MNLSQINSHKWRMRRLRKRLRKTVKALGRGFSAFISMADTRSVTTSIEELEAFEKAENLKGTDFYLSNVTFIGQRDSRYIAANGYWDAPSSRNPQ